MGGVVRTSEVKGKIQSNNYQTPQIENYKGYVYE